MLFKNSCYSIWVRLFLTISYIGVLYYNERYVHIEGEQNASDENSIFTGKYTLLTNLNLAFLTGSLVYSSFCCLMSESSILHKLNGILGGASSTMSLFVFTLFWVLYAIDRELVYPEIVDTIIPPWLNHALHTAIVPASLINFCLVPRSSTPGFMVVQLSTAFLAVAYIAWIHVIHRVTGNWVYPILEVLSAGQRVVFIGVCCLTMLPFSYAVHLLKARINGRSGGSSCSGGGGTAGAPAKCGKARKNI